MHYLMAADKPSKDSLSDLNLVLLSVDKSLNTEIHFSALLKSFSGTYIMTVLHEGGTFTGQVKRTRTHLPSNTQ